MPRGLHDPATNRGPVARLLCRYSSFNPGACSPSCGLAPKGDDVDSWIAIERPGQRRVRFDSNGALIPQDAQDEQYGTVFYNVPSCSYQLF